jgi:multiple sugar transport system permease protein
VDGASRWAAFWHITLPSLRPVTMFVTLITIIASANMFGQSFIMTNGGPAQETRTAIFYIAETGLQNFQMGEAAAASWILTVALMVLSVLVFGVFRLRGALEAS